MKNHAYLADEQKILGRKELKHPLAFLFSKPYTACSLSSFFWQDMFNLYLSKKFYSKQHSCMFAFIFCYYDSNVKKTAGANCQ